MSPAWVWDRLKLNDLIPEAKQLLEEERISIGHAILIARLKTADQQRVISVKRTSYGQLTGGIWQREDARLPDGAGAGRGPYDSLKPKTVRELEHWITDHVRFDVDHAAKAAPLDFEPVKAQVDVAVSAPGRGKKVIAITYDHMLKDDARSGDERTYSIVSWRRADGLEKSKICEHAVLGVVVAGKSYGQAFQVCVARDRCRTHFGQELAAKEKAQKLRDSGKGKQAARVEKRAAESSAERWKREQEERQRREKAWEAVESRAFTALGTTLLKAAASKVLAQAIKVAVTEIINPGDQKVITSAFGKLTAKNLPAAVVLADIIQNSYDFDDFTKRAAPWAVDVDDLKAEYKQLAAPPKPEKPAAAANKKGKKR
jgi:hypothetical protein